MHYLSYFFILLGLYFIITSIIFLIRVEGFYNKLHAISVIECFAIPLVILGLIFLQTDIFSIFKLIFIIIMIWILNPASTFALANAFYIQERYQKRRQEKT